MTFIFLVVNTALLGLIAWQDFNERAISAWLLIALTVSEFIASQIKFDSDTFAQLTLQNSMVVISLISIIWIYINIKNRKWMNLFKEGFGSADLLLLLILGMTFPCYAFILFMLTGFVLALAGTLVVRIRLGPGERTIPLAGYLSVWAMLSTILLTIFPKCLPDDRLIMFLLTGTI